jgi:hypothetical protein
MPDNKLSAKQAHGPTHRFVFEPRGRTDPRSIGLIRGTYDLHDKVLSPPLIVAADHPNAHHVLNEGDEIEVAEDDWALLHLVENIYKDLFRYARCSAPAIEPEPLPAKKRHSPVRPDEPARHPPELALEQAFDRPKKPRGRPQKKRKAAAEKMRADLREQRLTPDELRKMKQIALAKEYDCGREAACSARDDVLSEIEFPTNSDTK